MKLVRGKVNFSFQIWSIKAMLLATALLCFWCLALADLPERPNPPRLVNDFANVLSAAEKQQLEDKLVAYSDSTSTQITIVTIQSLEGAEVGSYAAELGEKWGVGTKQNHNGVLILMALKERKVSIRTGYGVEEKLGAVTCDRIIKNKIVPNFKNRDYYKAFDFATDEMIQRLQGMYKATDDDEDKIPLWVIILIIFIVFFILPTIFRNTGGGTYSRRGYFSWGGGIGIPSGGSWGGGGGGGFGGFGGGGFSGGGASGSW